jgi:hypothetical protein
LKDVSEERLYLQDGRANIARNLEAGRVFACIVSSSNVKVEAVSSYETSVNYEE